MSQSDLRLHFGVGRAKVIDVIEVKWPTTQAVERFTQVHSNQILIIREGSGIVDTFKPEAAPASKTSPRFGKHDQDGRGMENTREIGSRIFMKIPYYAVLLLFTFTFLTASSCGQTNRTAHQLALRAISPSFWSLFDRNAHLERLATGFGFAEGPLWDSAGFVYVSDEEQNKIYRVYADGHHEELIALGDPDGNTYDRRHHLIDCASVLRAIIRIEPDGKYIVLADRFDGQRFNSPNDVVVGPDGAIYFTDPTLDLPRGEKQEIPFQGVYRLDHEGEVRLLTKELTQPNGLAFSPDGRKLYVDDSEQRNIRVYDFHADGTVSKGRIFATEAGPPKSGVPDGMKLDKNGNLYITGPEGIWIWDAEGHHLGTIVMPEQPANLAWGDPDYGTLYITASKSVYKLRTKVQGDVPYLKSAGP